MATQHPPRSSAASTVKQSLNVFVSSRRGGEFTFCGYPDETQSVDNESGQALGGINLYEYVAGRAVTAVDPWGLVESYVTHEGLPLDVPVLTNRSAPVDMGRGSDGKCRFYRNYYYKEFLGTIYNGGSSTFSGLGEELLNAVVRGVANLTPVTKLVSLWTSDLTATSATFIWDAYGIFEKPTVFMYTCCTHFENIQYESTKLKNGNPSLVSANESAADVNNVSYPASGINAKKRAAETTFDALQKFLDALEAEK